MAIGSEQVEPSIQIVVQEGHSELQQEAAGRSDAFSNRFVIKQKRLVLCDTQCGHLVGEIANSNANLVIVTITCRINTHCAPRVAVTVESDAGRGANFLERAITL